MLKCLLEFLKPSCRCLFQSIKRDANMTNTVTHYVMILLVFWFNSYGCLGDCTFYCALTSYVFYHIYRWVYPFHSDLFLACKTWGLWCISKIHCIDWKFNFLRVSKFLDPVQGRMSFTNSKTLYKLRAYFKHVWLNWVSGPILTVTRLLEDYVLWFEALEFRSKTEGLVVLPEIPRAENVEWIICWTSELGWGVQAMWAVQTA